jgi:OOP family OmpA-OmpF porin
MRKLILAMVAGATALAATAQNANVQFPRSYLGLGAATVDHDYSIAGASNIDADGYDTSYKVFGGYEWDPVWGVEAGYTDFRSSDFSFRQNSQNNQGSRGESDGYGVYVAAKGRLPLNEQFDAIGKLGVAYSHRETSTRTGLNIDDNDTGIYAGVGLQWNLNPQWSITAEYERYGKSKDNGAKADVFTIAGRYNF